ncbi:hypothetical protein ACWDUL_21220 [Nocardia niigatensis]
MPTSFTTRHGTTVTEGQWFRHASKPLIVRVLDIGEPFRRPHSPHLTATLTIGKWRVGTDDLTAAAVNTRQVEAALLTGGDYHPIDDPTPPGPHFELVDPAAKTCPNPACDGVGGVPCDCRTTTGKPRVYCRLTHSAASTHPCPTCCPDYYPTTATKEPRQP